MAAAADFVLSDSLLFDESLHLSGGSAVSPECRELLNELVDLETGLESICEQLLVSQSRWRVAAAQNDFCPSCWWREWIQFPYVNICYVVHQEVSAEQKRTVDLWRRRFPTCSCQGPAGGGGMLKPDGVHFI